ncbi:unnamed protein product [Phaedon cochleariae]|uniref:K Homology domain-containing protein n=1 Tax=Phaedon cochleariae TaxID=80249 RepID=A0A9P0GVU8_PHACE|nr:unnamed protein product [Phaedon cochleariae]
MSPGTGCKEVPDFFKEKGAIQTTTKQICFDQNIYWMSSVVTKDDAIQKQTYLKPYDDNEGGLLDCGEIEDNYDIVLTKSGKFMSSFYVPSSLISHIIGAKGSKLHGLQRATNTLIKVPKANEKGVVKITGDTERKVASARTQISMIVMQRKEKLPITHFISIPIVSDGIKHKLKEFQDDILSDPPTGVTRSLFQNPEKLHLTICTLILVDEEELKAAKQVLTSCYEEVIANLFQKGTAHRIHLKGIEIMNDDPSSVQVLYGNVLIEEAEQHDKLQVIADKISEYYYKSGLAKKQYEKVKLHVTLMNTSFQGTEEKQTFDATGILQKYKNYSFGSVDFKDIHLSVRFTGKNEYYDAAAIVNIF